LDAPNYLLPLATGCSFMSCVCSDVVRLMSVKAIGKDLHLAETQWSKK